MKVLEGRPAGLVDGERPTSTPPSGMGRPLKSFCPTCERLKRPCSKRCYHRLWQRANRAKRAEQHREYRRKHAEDIEMRRLERLADRAPKQTEHGPELVRVPVRGWGYLT